jgi:hypothetical protein
MRWTRQRPARDVSQGGFRLVSDNGAQTIDVAAYGKAVWSWHPLLVSSRRRHPSHVRQVDDEAAVAKAATCPILSSPANRNRNAVFPRRPQCRLDVGCRKTMCYQTRLVLDGAIPKADGARVAIGAGLESRASARLEILPDRSQHGRPASLDRPWKCLSVHLQIEFKQDSFDLRHVGSISRRCFPRLRPPLVRLDLRPRGDLNIFDGLVRAISISPYAAWTVLRHGVLFLQLGEVADDGQAATPRLHRPLILGFH